MNQSALRQMAAVAIIVLLAGCAAQAPAPVRQSGSAPGVATTGVAPAAGESQRIHVVRPGDTLMGIGRLYGRNVNDLALWNGLSDPNQLRIGQEIRVSPPSSASGAAGAVAIAQPIDLTGQSGSMGDTPVYEEPRGGRQPYSDQAWAALRPDASPSVAAAAPSEAAAPPPAATGTGWLWPASGPIVARFDEATNKGVGIGGNPGDPVVASAAGSVVYAGSGLRGYGKLVIIKHDDEYLTAYAHNQSLLVKEGDVITRGQRIAELGSTDADRPKLHFEIRRQGRPVDPMQYLPPR